MASTRSSPFIETLESKRLYSIELQELPGNPVQAGPGVQILKGGDELWSPQVAIVQTDGGDLLRISGWVGSGSIGVTFAQPELDDVGRWILPVTFTRPGEGLFGSCDMKNYINESLLPDDFSGQIVLRTTEARRNLVGSDEGGMAIETEIVSTTDTILREPLQDALPNVPVEPAVPQAPTELPEAAAAPAGELLPMDVAPQVDAQRDDRPSDLILTDNIDDIIGDTAVQQ